MQLKAQAVNLDVESKLIFNAAVDDNDEPYELQQEVGIVVRTPIEKIFKPKFGPEELKSRRIQSSSVLITHVIHPNHLYVQIEDQDLPLYHQLKEDLQKEFRGATNQSPSYCSSPVVGT